jgi:hypothetical protein
LLGSRLLISDSLTAPTEQQQRNGVFCAVRAEML